MTDKSFRSATTCYGVNMDIMKRSGQRRHVADCFLRFGIVLLMEGKLTEAKQKLKNSRRIYELAEDLQGYSYCEAVLAECEAEGPKVSLTVTLLLAHLVLIDLFMQCSISRIFLRSLLELFWRFVNPNIYVHKCR